MTVSNADSWAARIERARNGSASDLGALLEGYRNYLSILARIQLGNRLKSKVSESDVVQLTFARACQRFYQFRGASQEEMAGWLRQILASSVSNQVRHYVAVQSRQAHLESHIHTEFDSSSMRLDSALLNKEKSPSSHFGRQEQAILLANAIETLAPRYRDVILSRYFKNMTFPQIAKAMDRSEDSVQKLWWRGLAKLRTLMDDHEGHP